MICNIQSRAKFCQKKMCIVCQYHLEIVFSWYTRYSTPCRLSKRRSDMIQAFKVSDSQANRGSTFNIGLKRWFLCDSQSTSLWKSISRNKRSCTWRLQMFSWKVIVVVFNFHLFVGSKQFREVLLQARSSQINLESLHIEDVRTSLRILIYISHSLITFFSAHWSYNDAVAIEL